MPKVWEIMKQYLQSKLGSEIELFIFIYNWEGKIFHILQVYLDNDAGVKLIVEALKIFGPRLLDGRVSKMALTQAHIESCALGRSFNGVPEWLSHLGI